MPAEPEPNSVAILIVTYNSLGCISRCLESIDSAVYQTGKPVVVVVDNHSTDGTLESISKDFPDVDLVSLSGNLGFAGGCNRGWDHIRTTYPDVRYVMLLNPDTVVSERWLPPLIEQFEARPSLAAAQCKILLLDEKSLINTAGNRSHFLGFGFMTGYKQVDRGQYDQVKPIDFASGAAVMLRRKTIEKTGLFEGSFFMYLEDADLSWKLRQQGYEVMVVPGSVIYHQYEPTSIENHYYYLERNRWILLLTYYRLRTLVIIAPALLLMEVGQLLFSLATGQLIEKLRSYVSFLSPNVIQMIRRRRRTARAARIVSDYEFMGKYSGEIQLPGVQYWVWTKLANPMFALYWSVAKRLIDW